ncbi:MAG TPA: SRPBCC family protein [Pyrinomonadaceae bacterium]
MERTEKSIEINAPVGVVFGLYSDFEKFPQWMEHIKEVRQTEPRFTKWAADAPLGINVEWEAETTELEENRKIAWRTVRGDIEMQGEVTFEETESDKTILHVSIAYEPPAGHLGTLLAKFFGNDPEKQMDEDLSRFVKLAESRAKKLGRTSSRKRSGQNKRTSNRRAA